MWSHSIRVYILCLALGLPLLARGAETEASATPSAEASATKAPAIKIGISKFRFHHHDAKNIDRLVLEFTREADFSTEPPKIAVTQAATNEAFIRVDNMILTGAIPEARINAIYAKKAKHLGPIQLNVDGPIGFSLRLILKKNVIKVKARWLTDPDRLVIDVSPPDAGEIVSRYAPRIERYASGITGRPSTRSPASLSQRTILSRYICFPQDTKVGLAVIFRAQQHSEEALQNFRVNLEGSPSGLPDPGDPEKIICYPKNAQVKASFAFEDIPRLPEPSSPALSMGPPAYFNTPVTGPSAAAMDPAAAEQDLDPGPLLPGADASLSTSSATPPPLPPTTDRQGPAPASTLNASPLQGSATPPPSLLDLLPPGTKAPATTSDGEDPSAALDAD